MFSIGRSLSFTLLNRLIQQKFPAVRSLSTAELAQWLAAPVQPILLDAREEAEFAVSHLKSARRIDPKHPDWQPLTKFKTTPIVVYCSVGYRSARVAEQLQQAGFSQVLNLKGSIFQWANEGRSLFRQGQPTQQVHPYNSLWGLLLHPCYRGGGSDDRRT